MKGSSDQLIAKQMGATISPETGTINKHLDEILAKLSADPATQTTLAAILAKIIAAPASEAKQDTGNTSLESINDKLTDTRLSGAWSNHRTAVSAADKIATPTLVTCADEVDKPDGAIAQTTSCKVAISAGTSYGPAGAGTGAAIITTVTATDGKATHSILVTVPQAMGADSDTVYYLFISTDAAPKLLGTITEAQRAAGGAKLKANGAFLSDGDNAAGTVRLCALGTGDVTTATRFLTANSNAYQISGVTAIDSSTHRKHFLTVLVSQTGTQMNVQGAPSLTIIPFITDAAGNVGQGTPITMNIMQTVGQSSKQSYVFDIAKAPAVRYLLVPAYCTVSLRVEAQ